VKILKSNTQIPDRSKSFVVTIDKVKVRQHFSLIQKMFEDKKEYSRKKENSAWRREAFNA